MTAGAVSRPWRVALVLIVGLGATLAAPDVTAQPAAVDDAQAPAPPVYRDRVIAPDRLAPLPPDDGDADAAALDGPPRSIRLELNASRTERGDEAFEEVGLAAAGFWESGTLGSFSLDATLFRSDREQSRVAPALGGSATLWQRQLHVDGGWRVDNGLGVLNTPALPLVRQQPRFFLPTAPLAGASTDWSRAGVQLQAAGGRAGIQTGTRVRGFEPADGHVAALGAQWVWAPRWAAASTLLATDGRVVPNALGEATFEAGRTRAWHAATAWTGEPGDSLQLNLLASERDGEPAFGGWLDASLRRGRLLHSYGLFSLEPQLSWGALPINNDLQGAYYRLGYQYGRWIWNGGLDRIDSVSGLGFDGLYGTGFARYQASSTVGVGGSLSLRRASSVGHASQWFADRRGAWGQTRLQIDLADDGEGVERWQLGLDHAFALRAGARLSTSVAYGALTGDEARTTTVALTGGRDFGDDVSLDGNVRWLSADGVNSQRGLDFNVTANWRVAARWWLSATLYQSRGSQRSPFVLDPLVTDLPFISIPRERSMFLTLRHERQAGRPYAVIGGAPGAAVGGVGGSVFLDENDNGVRDASELPAAYVTVVLDGRYSVRTDSAGRFEFPRVAVGAHTITVEPDNLPLPWSFEGDDAQRTIQVGVRENARVELGARRPR